MITLANGNERGSFLERSDRQHLYENTCEVAKQRGVGHVTTIKQREDLDDFEFEIVEDDDSVVYMGIQAIRQFERWMKR